MGKQYALRRMAFNCHTNQCQRLSLTQYDEDGFVIKRNNNDEQYGSDWVEIKPFTIIEGVAKIVCYKWR